MAEVKWQARRVDDGVLVDVTGDTSGTPAVAPTPNALEAGSTFNGGTVTEPLTVESGVDETQLTVEGIVGQDQPLIKANLGGTTPGLFLDVWDGQAVVAVGAYSPEAGTAGRVLISGEDQGAAGIASVSVADDLGQQAITLTANPTANVLSVVTGGVVRLRINKTGYLIVQTVAAPADADLSANQMALWFDATNGAGKLMIKAKTANGTVVTGNVALA